MRYARILRCRTLAVLATASLAVLLGGLGTQAWANMPVQPQVTGQVSAVEGTTAVTVNGTTYLIAANSPAFQTIQDVKPGDTIGLVLDGPAGASTTQVIYIVTNAGSAGAGSAASSGSADSGSDTDSQ